MSIIIALKTAVDEIFRTRFDLPDREPFFFIVGAGVSSPSIKTASMLVSSFMEKYETDRVKYDLPEVITPAMGPIDSYSFWFEKAYPQPILRRNFLKQEMAGKPPSPAILRLAHLLVSKKLANIVVTPNFDDLLYQALFLFGTSPIFCDHPATVSRIEIDNRSDVQLIHVHGTYNFYDACNLRGEVSELSSNSERDSMSFFLNQLLSHRSPIVIGYSGWEHDVIMSAIYERLRLRPASYIYWFCHTEESYSALPERLRQSQYVRFVVPLAAVHSGSSNIEIDSTEYGESEDAPHNITASDLKPTLSAVEILDAINEKFDIEEPLITKDPFEYLALRLEPMYKSAGAENPRSADSYDFSSVVKRLRHAGQVETADRQDTESSLEMIRASIRSSRYKRARSLSISSLSKFVSVAKGGDISPLRELFELFDLSITNSEIEGISASLVALREAAKNLFERSNEESDHAAILLALTMQADRVTAQMPSEAIKLLEQVLTLIENQDSVDLQVIKYSTKYRLGRLISRYPEKRKTGIELLDQVINAPENVIGAPLALIASNAKGFALLDDDNEAALAAYEAAVERFKRNASLRSEVTQSIQGASRASNRLKRYEKTLQIVATAKSFLKKATNVRERVSIKLLSVSKGFALLGLGEAEKAIEAFEVIASLDPVEQKISAVLPQINSLQQLANIYQAKGEPSRAKEYYQTAIDRFSDTDNKHAQLHLRACRLALDALNNDT